MITRRRKIQASSWRVGSSTSAGNDDVGKIWKYRQHLQRWRKGSPCIFIALVFFWIAESGHFNCWTFLESYNSVSLMSSSSSIYNVQHVVFLEGMQTARSLMRDTYASNAVAIPSSWDARYEDADFGGIEITHLPKVSQTTRSDKLACEMVSIHRDDASRYHHDRRNLLRELDKDETTWDTYYEPDEDPDATCRRPNWAWVPHPNCVMIHEIPLRRSIRKRRMKHVSHGTYRDTWLYRSKTMNHTTTVAYKTFRAFRKGKALYFNPSRMTQIMIDANIMEALTGSDRITDIYGFCGSTVITEALEDTLEETIVNEEVDAKLKDFDWTKRYNNLTLWEKLDWAIQFSEALAELHGYPRGAMMHGDFHSPQWLVVQGTSRIKLNDFNKGHIFFWNVSSNEYCPTERCFKDDYRAPEDMRCVKDGHEASDTFTLGNDIYVLLTGLWPHADWRGSTRPLIKLIRKGDRKAYVDPSLRNRTFIEDSLIEVMEWCWEFDFNKRVSVFKVLQRLYEVRDQVQRQGQTPHGRVGQSYFRLL